MAKDNETALAVAPNAAADPSQTLAAVGSGVVDLTRLQPNEAAGYLMLSGDRWRNLLAQCETMVKGNALPRSIVTPAQAAQIALKGIEMGIPLSSAWSGMRIIDGEVCVLGKLALRLIQQRALPLGAVCRRLQVPVEQRKERAGWLMGRPGEDPEEFWYTIEEAEAAGLLKIYSHKQKKDIEAPAWKNFPERMLPWRALAYGAGYVFADVLQGCLITEEMSHKDPIFIEQQLVDAGEKRPVGDPSLSFTPDRGEQQSQQPSSSSAPRRDGELPTKHERVQELAEFVRTLCKEVLRRDPIESETKEQWKDRFRELFERNWSDLFSRHIAEGYKAPTQPEVEAMMTEMRDEIRKVLALPVPTKD